MPINSSRVRASGRGSPADSSSGNAGCSAEACWAADGEEGRRQGSQEAADSRVARGGQARLPAMQQWQQQPRQPPLHLSAQELQGIAELCRDVVDEHEAELEALAAAVSGGLGAPKLEAPSAAAAEVEGFSSSSKRTAAESLVRRQLAEPESFAAYAALRPVYFQELRVQREAPADGQEAAVPEERGRGGQKDTDVCLVCLQDVKAYVQRTLAALLLASPSPVRLDELRKCWQANPQHLRMRNLGALVMSSAAKAAASCFGLELTSFCMRGEEEVRGFLLFLTAQFLSSVGELPLETLKANLRLVGRADLLQDFEEASLFKPPHLRDQPLKLDSLGALLLSCESLKYITLTRRPLGLGAEDAVYVSPSHRLLQELQLAAFRAECREQFGVEPPEGPLQPPDTGGPQGGASQLEAPA
ncbi:hypothetical protein Efla_006819 [Eimeria flavescens]